MFSIAPTKKSRHIMAKTHVGRIAIGEAEPKTLTLSGQRESGAEERERERGVRVKRQ